MIIKLLVPKRIVLIVSGTNEITIDEIGEINDHIQAEAGHNAYYHGGW
jgi:hypothetical protein